MSWDGVMLFILAFFGALTLVLSHLGDVLTKIAEIIRAWHEVRRSMRGNADDRP